MREPIALTIGNFDGVHIGHKKLLGYMKKKVAPSGSVALLTFVNHPAEVLGRKPPPPLCTTDEKIKLLEKEQIDLLILLTFTPEIATEDFDAFLKKIHKKLPFSFLILGKGAAFGKERKGDEARVKAVQKELNFEAEYLEKEEIDGRVISSQWIREELAKNDRQMAEKLLGRKL